MQQGVGVGAVLGKQRRADAGLHVYLQTVQGVGRRKRLLDLVYHGINVVERRERIEDDREFIAAEPRQGVGLAHHVFEPARHVFQ